MAERQTLLRVLKRCFERALRDAGRLRGDADTPTIQRRKRNLVTFAFISDSIGQRYRAVREDKLAASRGVYAQLFLFLSYPESRRAFLYDERGNAFLSFCWVCIQVHNRRIRSATIGNPRLCPVKNVCVPFFHRF